MIALWMLAACQPQTTSSGEDTAPPGPTPLEVSGVAWDPAQEVPLEGVEVLLQGSSEAVFGVTDGEGRFSLSVVEPAAVTAWSAGRTAVTYTGLNGEAASDLGFVMAKRSVWDEEVQARTVHLKVSGQPAGSRVCARWAGADGEYCVNSPGNSTLDLQFDAHIAEDYGDLTLVVVAESVSDYRVLEGAKVVWTGFEVEMAVELSPAAVRTLSVVTNQPEVADKPLDTIDPYHTERAAQVVIPALSTVGFLPLSVGRAVEVLEEDGKITVEVPYFSSDLDAAVMLDLSRTYTTGHRALAQLPLRDASSPVTLVDGPDVETGVWSPLTRKAWRAVEGAAHYEVAVIEGGNAAWRIYTRAPEVALPPFPEDWDVEQLFTQGEWEVSSHVGEHFGWEVTHLSANPTWQKTITKGGTARW